MVTVAQFCVCPQQQTPRALGSHGSDSLLEWASEQGWAGVHQYQKGPNSTYSTLKEPHKLIRA